MMQRTGKPIWHSPIEEIFRRVQENTRAFTDTTALQAASEELYRQSLKIVRKEEEARACSTPLSLLYIGKYSG